MGKRFKKSLDELTALQEKQRLEKIEPGQEAVRLLENAMNKVWEYCGFDLTRDIKMQQIEERVHVIDSSDLMKAWLGVDDVITPQLQGFYIIKQLEDGNLAPVALVGNAVIRKGKISVPIIWLLDNMIEYMVGSKLTKE